MDRDGYEDKLKELNGKVIPGVTNNGKRLVVEVRTYVLHSFTLSSCDCHVTLLSPASEQVSRKKKYKRLRRDVWRPKRT